MLVLNILGAIAILLWSTRMVCSGISRFMGVKLSAMIGYATKNRFYASLTGMGIATMLQSSTATGMLTTSFAKKHGLSVAMGIAIMLGADVGSTLIVQILTFNVSWLSPIAFVVGYAIFRKGEDTHMMELGRALMGIGLIILSINLMTSAMHPLRDNPIFIDLLTLLFQQTWIAVIVVAFITWCMHSSIAMVLVIIGLTKIHSIDFPLALSLILGINIGASFIPVILTVKSPSIVRQILVGNLLIRATLAVVLLVILPTILPPLQRFLFNTLALSGEISVAIFHTAFNVSVLCLGLPVVHRVATVCIQYIPSRQKTEYKGAKLLDKKHVNTPALALSAAEREVVVQADYVETMLVGVLDAIQNNDIRKIQHISKLDDYVDALYEDIKMYVTKVTVAKMSEEESIRATNTIVYTTNLEHVGDIIDNSLLALATKKRNNNISFTEAGWKDIKTLHTLVLEQLRLSVATFMKGNVQDARQLLLAKRYLQQLEHKTQKAHFARLRQGIGESLKSSSLHLDIVRDIKRINTHLVSIAYPILERYGELHTRPLKDHNNREDRVIKGV